MSLNKHYLDGYEQAVKDIKKSIMLSIQRNNGCRSAIDAVNVINGIHADIYHRLINVDNQRIALTRATNATIPVMLFKLEEE
jgi:hypothetical protein